jgi:hypothetical protein
MHLKTQHRAHSEISHLQARYSYGSVCTIEHTNSAYCLMFAVKVNAEHSDTELGDDWYRWHVDLLFTVQTPLRQYFWTH